MVVEGDQVVVGDTEGPVGASAEIAYEVLCRHHHRQRMTRARAGTGTRTPLPFDRVDRESFE